MKIIVVLVAVVMATICLTGVHAQEVNETESLTDFLDGVNDNTTDLDSDDVSSMANEIESLASDGSSVGWNPSSGHYYRIRPRKCEEGPYRIALRDPGVLYFRSRRVPVRVNRCIGSCPRKRRGNCIARKKTKRITRAITVKKFNVWGRYIWFATSRRVICVVDESECECKTCADIKNYYECIRTKPCPDKTDKNTRCFWKPYGSWVNSHSSSWSSWGSCDCCPITKCNNPKQFLDRRQCKCRCKPIKCPGLFKQDPDTCKCVCPVKDIDCGRKKRLNPKSCQCECRGVCTCRPPRELNRKTCHCDCPELKCKRPFKFNPATCMCQCHQHYKCGYGYYFNPRTCRCYYDHGYKYSG